MPHRVLIVDDEADIADLIAYNLTSSGYETHTAHDGQTALRAMDEFQPHLLVLDIMMPGLNGYEVLKRVRKQHTRLPVIMLTAKNEETDVLAGFTEGADDYVTKPFSMQVLKARVEALLRRTSENTPPPSILRFGPISINKDIHEARLDGDPLTLTVTEFRLLCAMIEADGKVLSRRALIQRAMGAGVTITERTIDVHITSIRKKLGGHAPLIKTVRGVGYRTQIKPGDAPGGARNTKTHSGQ